MKNVISKSIDITVGIARIKNAADPHFGQHTLLILGELFVEFSAYRVLSTSPWADEYEFIGVKKLVIFEGTCDEYKVIHSDWISRSADESQIAGTIESRQETFIQPKIAGYRGKQTPAQSEAARARADARDFADIALKAYLEVAPLAWCIQYYHDYEGSEVLAVFATKEAANAALPLFEHKGDIEVGQLPFFAS